MLQWMGGSRRKVIASRKSSHNRQKQYFERRRQQQATRSKEKDDGRNRIFSFNEYPCSLDVLSLNNLATTAEQFGVAENDGDSQVKASEDFPEFVSDKNVASSVVSASKDQIRMPEDSLDFSSDRAIAEKLPCTRKGNSNKCVTSTVAQESPSIAAGPSHSDKTHGRLDGRSSQSFSHTWNTSEVCAREDKPERTPEDQFSLLDLLSDTSHKSEEALPGESHAAFYVKGLGKAMMETPAHSPEKAAGEFMASDSNFDSPQSMKTGWMCSFHDLSDDLKLKMSNLDDTYLWGGDNLASTNAGRFGMFEDLSDDRKVSWSDNLFHMDFGSAKLSETESYAAHDYDFEHTPYENERRSAEAWDRFNISDDLDGYFMLPKSKEDCSFINAKSKQASYHIHNNIDDFFMHLKSKKEHSFINEKSNQASYPTLSKDRHHRVKRKQPAFTTTDYTSDDIGTPSEESCSSTAVEKEGANKVRSGLYELRENTNKSKKAKNSQNNSGANIFTNKLKDEEDNGILQEKNLIGIEKDLAMATQWVMEAKSDLKRKPVERTPAEEEILQDRCKFLSGDEHSSDSVNLDPGVRFKHSTLDVLEAFGCKLNIDVSSGPFASGGMGMDPSQRISSCVYAKHDHYGRAHSDKDTLRGSLGYVAWLPNLHFLNKGKIIMNQHCDALNKGRRFSSVNARIPMPAESVEHKKLKFQTQEARESSECSNVRHNVLGVDNRLSGPSSHQRHREELKTENHKLAGDNTERERDGKVDALMLESSVFQLLCVRNVLLKTSNQEQH